MSGLDEVLSDHDAVPKGPRVLVRAPENRRGVRFTSNIVGPLLLARDLLCLILAAPLALLTYQQLFSLRLVESVHLFAITAFLATFLLIRSSKQAYHQALMSASNNEDSLVDLILSGLVATALVFLLGMVDSYSRGISLMYLAYAAVLLVASRPFFKKYLTSLAKRGLIEQRIAFYGADPDSIQGIRRLMASLDMPHLRFVGVADDRPRVASLEDLPLLGGYRELTALARSGEIDQVLISVREMPAHRLHEILERLSEVSVDVSLIPAQAIDLAPDYKVNLLGTVPVLTLWQRPFRDLNGIAKRAEDLLIGGIAVILVSPILLVTALLIRLTSPGRILFVQPRVGFNNEVINVFKFRSMYADRADLQGNATTTKDDDRITAVGKVIRKLSIDELPQLFNVLTGDMSLVGPRPHATHMKVGERFYQDAVRGYAGRHRVKPGITGLAQVRGLRGEIRTVERAKRRVELDKEYIDRWSVWLDLRIMLSTVRAVLFDADAY